jgi:hypothetical protein
MEPMEESKSSLVASDEELEGSEEIVLEEGSIEEEKASEEDEEEMTDPSARWLGGCEPLKDARSTEEATSKLAGIPKKERKNLAAKDLNNLKLKAEEGMKEKFKLMEPIMEGAKASRDQLKSIYSVTLRVEEFRRSLQSFDMDDVFIIPSKFERQEEEDWPATDAKTINLFTAGKNVSDLVVKTASTFMMKRGQEFHVENLLWSGAKLLNSCDDKLRQKIEEQTIGWPVEHATGPVYFKVMIHLILASSAQSLRGLTLQLEKLTIKDIDGENVADYVSFARGAIEQLRNNNALPIDVLTILVDALKVSSTESFNAFVTSMYNNHVQGVKTVTAEDVLRAAEEEYINLTSGLKWNSGTSKKDQESIFFAGKCHACGLQGHIAANCRRQQAGRGFGGRGGQGGRGGRGGRNNYGSDGRGRGGRGGRGGRYQGGGFRYHDRNPPKAGEPKVRMRNGREEKWCGRHGYWTWNPGAHTTEECTMRSENANVAKTELATSNESTKEAIKPSILKQDQDGGEKKEKTVRFGSGFVSHVQNFV